MSIRRVVICLSLVFLAAVLIGIPFRSQLSSQGTTQTPTVLAGRNVNMVSGTTLPGGDPWLQRQNEPTIAVSSRNPLHLLAGANDYRTVDMPKSEGELPGKTPVAMVGDAWLGVFTSHDGGESWTSTMLPGFPQDPNANPLKGYSTAADPVVRSGPNGIFYYSGIAFNRTNNLGVVFVARFIDNNNQEGGNTIQYIDTKIIATGTASKFLDKPWIAIDQPRAPMTNIAVLGQSIPRHNVYIAYSAFSGTGSTLGDIMFARSNDCGTTWGTPIKISTGSFAHQGATIAIKPVLGEVLVAWRRFAQPGKTPDSIFVAQSFSRGLDFQSPIKVADIAPFDQPTTDGTHSLPGTANGYAFRINSYPTMTVDKSGHVYLAWSQRGVGPSGDARIMLCYSYLGTSWSTPQPVANLDENGAPFLGHQIMPSFSFAAGKLILIWYDQRHDVSGTMYGFNNWVIDSLWIVPGSPFRHTMDVWAAAADTAAFPNLSWKSTQVSRYLYAALKDGSGNLVYDTNNNPVIFPVQFNCVNYPLFKGGTNPFDGDYIDVAASPSFRLDSWRNWIFNMDNANSPEFHVAWTDNRDVRPPANGDWTQYTPATRPDSLPYQDPIFTSSSHPACAGGNAPGMRNQNIYTSRITWGIEAGSPVNDKPLNLPGGIARAFVVYVKNNTGSLRSFVLTIAAQPVGGQASFLQFGPLASLNVDIAPYSTISRPVFISSSDPNASVTVNINEINASGSIITGGLSSSVLINGDPTNPNLAGTEETHDPNIVNSSNPNIVNWSAGNPNIVNPNIVNPNIVNPNIVNPNIVNPNIVNPNIVNPNIVNPNIVNPNIVNPNIVNPNIVNYTITNPNIVNPNIVNPNIVNPNIVNATPADVSATDVEWTITNAGTATTSYTLKTLAKKSPPEGIYAQLLVYRVHYTPAVAGADLSSANTGISACELKQEPHQELVLNILNPNIVNPNIVNPNIVNPNIVNSSIEDATFSVAPGEDIIVDLRVLDTGVSASTTTSTAMVKAQSSTTSAQASNVKDFIDSLGFAVTSQAVNSKAVAAGSQIPPAAATALVIGTGSLPDGVVGAGYTATLNAYGGSGNYTWSLNSGALPTGLSLGVGGVISGTPTTPGTFHFIVRVDDGIQFDTQQYSILVNSSSIPGALAIVTTTLPSGVQGNWYGATLEATGGVWPRTWSLASGALPDGLILDSGGVINGTPTVSRSFSFAVRVTDRNGTAVTQSLSLIITANSFTYDAISGYVYSETGQPLAGVVLRGLPDTPVTDANGFYTDNVPGGWSGTVTPFIVNHSFTPASITYTNVTAPFSVQNYNQPAQIPVSTISGRVMYNGNPVSQYSSKQATFWARNEGTGQGIQITPTYNPSDGTYSIPNIPSGSYGIQVYIDQAPPYDGEYLPGDYWGWTSPIAVNAPNPANVDLICQKIMHLTSPIDNSTGSSPIPPPYDAFFSPVMFQWDAIGEAATYSLTVDKYQSNPYQLLQPGVVIESGLTANQASLTLPVCGANEHYMFTLYALNANNVLVGRLMIVYSNGFGWDYRFRIIAPPTWTWISGSNTGNQVGIYGTQGTANLSNVPGARDLAVSWVDSSGKLWLFGGSGSDSANNYQFLNDLWAYDPATNEWTWVSGSNTGDQAGIYGDSTSLPGARIAAVSWLDSSGNLWLFGGFGYDSAGKLDYLNDLWEYAPTSNEWTWVSGSSTADQKGTYGTKGIADPSNVPGARENAVSWVDSGGKLWLFGGNGYDLAGNVGWINDLWKYDPTTNEWTWVSGSTSNSQAGIYGTKGVADPSNVPGARDSVVSWIDSGGKLWLFGGEGLDSAGHNGWLNDLWKYDPTTNEWTWASGSTTVNQAPIYGTKGTAAPSNVPGAREEAVSWIDSSGKLWLFGGHGYISAGTEAYLNDLWKYDPTTLEWTWISGSNSAPVYGTKGTADPLNIPGARALAVSWIDSSGNLWLFGGYGLYSASFGFLNDLWKCIR
jgi:N-acetylneuraminic acid mutarotase